MFCAGPSAGGRPRRPRPWDANYKLKNLAGECGFCGRPAPGTEGHAHTPHVACDRPCEERQQAAQSIGLSGQ
jgi:hypothetical protein